MSFPMSFLLAKQVYSLIGGFCGSPVNFHAKDGSGYKFLGELVVQLDKLNPQVLLKTHCPLHISGYCCLFVSTSETFPFFS